MLFDAVISTFSLLQTVQARIEVSQTSYRVHGSTMT